MSSAIYVVGTILFTAAGQVLLKWRMTAAGRMPQGLGDKVRFLLARFLDVWVLVGLLAAVAAAICWMAALTRFELSSVYPFMAISFVLVLALSAVLLGEHLSTGRLLGTGVIILGTIIVGMSR